jgi:hypothetical protein
VPRFSKRTLVSAIADAFGRQAGGGAGAGRQAALPSRRKPIVEPLEPRVLLSAELPVVPPPPQDQSSLSAPLDFGLQNPALQMAPGFADAFQATAPPTPAGAAAAGPQTLRLADGWGQIDLRATEPAAPTWALDFTDVQRSLQVEIGADGLVQVHDGAGNTLLARQVVSLVGSTGDDHFAFTGSGLPADTCLLYTSPSPRD